MSIKTFGTFDILDKYAMWYSICTLIFTSMQYATLFNRGKSTVYN
jgi:hypothetical protein